MSQLETIVDIHRPIAQVFAYLSDRRTMTAWAREVVEAKLMTPEPLGAGAAYRIVALLSGRGEATTLGPLIVADR